MPKRVPKYLKEISTQMEGPTQGDYASEWGFAKGRDETSAWDAEINGGEYLGWWAKEVFIISTTTKNRDTLQTPKVIIGKLMIGTEEPRKQ